jgi:2-polyprenyl-3-methyl-5-hydroxy-6-metoxy-1,4-benzoquinol methylase
MATVIDRRYSKMKRSFDPATPELMDRPQPVTSELERDLANLRALNHRFGSHRLVWHFLQRWLRPSSSVRVLDLATGSGDIPRLIVRFARANNIHAQIDAVDQQQATIEIAARLSGDFPQIHFHCADLLQWVSTEPYDVVLCSLALHHFSEDDAVRVLGRCRELSRGAVLVADLRRARWLSAAIWLVTTVVHREHMTKVDARLSAARAFSFAEMRDLAQRACWKNFQQARFAIGRQAIWIDSTMQGETRE